MKNVKKVLSLLLATVLLISVVPSFAIDELVDSTASVTTGEGTIGENPVQVSVTKGSTYTITIPKTIILAGSNGEGNYTVKVTGDLSGTEYISVEPYTNDGLNLLEDDNTFALSQAGKDDIQATVTQTKTEWSYGNMGDGTGKISVANLTSGSWSGSFKFNINRIETAVMMLEGDGQVVNKFAFPEVRFRSSAPMDTLNEVKINGEVVDPDNYIVSEGSTIITLKNEYVESLDLGNSTIEIVSARGTADGDFTVVNLIPDGGRYVDVNGNAYGPDEDNKEFPATPQVGDMYYYGDYQYKYGCGWCFDCNGWSDKCWEEWHLTESDNWSIHVKDNTKTEYDLPLSQINGNIIDDWSGAFIDCNNMLTAPIIPYHVVKLTATFKGCTSLKTYVGSTDADGDFSNYIIPDGVTNMGRTFQKCTSLLLPPVLPENVVSVYSLFYGCSKLTKAPVIPASAEGISQTFYYCTSLTGTIEINSQNPSPWGGCFDGVIFNDSLHQRTLTGTSPYLDEIGATGKNYCAECNGYCQQNH